MQPSGLTELAVQSGIVAEYVGTDGRPHPAGVETIRALLSALGLEVNTERDAEEHLAMRRDEVARRIVEPVLVIRTGRQADLPFRLPAGLSLDRATLTLQLESGESRRTALAAVLGTVRRSADGTAHGRLELGRAGGGELTPGIHALTIDMPNRVVQSVLVVAPSCPRSDRHWGAFMPLHAVRTTNNWGIGSYTDLAELATWVSELGGGFVGTLPLYPIDDRVPIDPSPYLPLSRLAYNELYIDPLLVPELAGCARARELLGAPDTALQLSALRSDELVDYEGVWALKSQVLALLFDDLCTRPTFRLGELQTFGETHPELHAYADFRAHQALPRPATGDPASDPLFHLYLQWLASTQLGLAGRAGAPLYADMPVGVRPDGFDTEWAPNSFATGAHGGAPPDAFFAGGQNWGFHPLHPEGLRHDGYRYLVASLRRACATAKFLRIDHVAGLHRLYWVPDGMPATDGAYVRYHDDEIRALVCLEAWRAGTVVVGEDLGTVPEEVRTAMEADHMLRSWVLEFESTEATPLPAPPPAVLASLGTHDLPRFATFLEAGDIENGGTDTGPSSAANVTERRRWRSALERSLGASDSLTMKPEQVIARCLEHLAAGPADLVLVDLEELWGERVPQNRPGTGPEAGNWGRKSSRSLEEMRTDTDRSAFLASLAVLRRQAELPDARMEVVAS
ncbi:MAG TPA: 4-alpha-glucanotransferase [Acidimicrobiales bacterium]